MRKSDSYSPRVAVSDRPDERLLSLVGCAVWQMSLAWVKNQNVKLGGF